MVIDPKDKIMIINEEVATITATLTTMAAMEVIANLEIDDLTIATRAVMKIGTLSKMTIGDHRDEHRVRRMISQECAVEIVVVDVVHHTIGIVVVVDTKNVVAAVAVMRE